MLTEEQKKECVKIFSKLIIDSDVVDFKWERPAEEVPSWEPERSPYKQFRPGSDVYITIQLTNIGRYADEKNERD